MLLSNRTQWLVFSGKDQKSWLGWFFGKILRNLGWVGFFRKVEEIVGQKFRFPWFWWPRCFQTDSGDWFLWEGIRNFGFVKSIKTFC